MANYVIPPRQTQEHLDHFLLQCETHDILTPSDKKYLEQLTTNAPKDAATRRGEKIARFKREKEMRNQIEVRRLYLVLV